MATDFQVIFTANQHFGDHEGMYEKDHSNVEFVGAGKTYSFDAPGVDASQPALLQCRAHGVSFRNNVLSVNGTEIPSAIVPSVERQWQTQLIVVPGGTLKAAGNELSIETRTRSGATEGNLDDFLVTNMVLLFK